MLAFICRWVIVLLVEKVMRAVEQEICPYNHIIGSIYMRAVYIM